MAFIPDEAVMSAHEIPAAALRMYLYFCMRRDGETGVCFPSLKRTATDLNLKYSYASEMRTLLLQKEWIEMVGSDIRPLKGFRQNPKLLSEKVEHPSSEKVETCFGKSRNDVRQNPNNVSEKVETHTITSPINQPTNQPIEPARGDRATTIPPRFVVTQPLLSWAAENVPQINIRGETENFLDYHRAKGSRFKDWDAAWRNWMRNAVRFESNGRKTQSELNRGGRGMVL